MESCLTFPIIATNHIVYAFGHIAATPNWNLKGIGLHRLSLRSEDGSQRDYHFATNFMEIR